MEENEEFLIYHTSGISMFPLIRGNDYVLVRKVPPQTISPGDTIVFESESKVKICHRVMAIEEKDGILWFRTKGIKNYSSDGIAVRQEQVLGKVVVIRRRMSAIDLSAQGWERLALKFDCCIAECIFYIKGILSKNTFLRKTYRYIKQKNGFPKI